VSLEVDVGLSLGGLLLDVQFTLEEGDVVVLLGPNGAGKTTLLRAIAGLIPIERGRVALDGEVLEDTAAGRYVPTEGRSMGFVFQDYLLFPHLSVLDNVAFGLRARGDGRAASEREALLNWPSRVASFVANDLGIAEREALQVLRKYIRQHLMERSGAPIQE